MTFWNTIVNNLRFQWGRDLILEVAGSNAPGPYVSLTNITNYGEFYALPRTAEPDENGPRSRTRYPFHTAGISSKRASTRTSSTK